MNSTPQTITISQAIQIALQHQKSGKLRQAEELYRWVLRAEPGNADALHLLGTVADQVGNHQKAVEFIEQALRSRPSDPYFLNNLANALRNLGRFQEAESKYREAIALKPNYAQAHYNLAGALEQLGRLEDAETGYRSALTLQPSLAEAHYNLGNLLQRLGRLSDAERSYREALALRPHYPEAHNNLANALKGLGRLDEAERGYREALRLRPDHPHAHCNLGATLHDLGRLAEAEESCRRGVALNPEYAKGHFVLGNVLRGLGRFDEAEQRYQHTLKLKPRHPEAHFNLGLTLKALGRLSEAERSYQQTLELKPDATEAQSVWIHESQYLCEWSALERDVETLRSRVRQGASGKTYPFPFLSMPGTSAGEQLACARQFAETEFTDLISRPPIFHPQTRRDKAKLRIGYLSADYHAHATSHLLPEVIEQHHRDRYEVYAYSYGPDDSSTTCQRIRAAFDVFRDVRTHTHEEAARQIRDDEIDILVDLKGYTPQARPQISALRPASIQVSWLGYPGTLGHPRLADYLIGDPIVTPLKHASYYSEQLALMPHCYQPNDRKRAIGARPTLREAGLPDEGFVFCCFNASYKLTPAMLDVWCSLLKDVPGSVLWLLDSYPGASANLWREIEARGVSAERIVLAPKLPIDQHLGRYQLADLALDTYPCTSHTTASDALWAGVPLVTLMGETFVSRVAASVLHAAGLPELVTRDPDSYFTVALELATTPRRMAALKKRLATNRMTCPLFDSPRFTRDLESLYERIWHDHRAGRRQPIVLQPGPRNQRDTASLKRRRQKHKNSTRG